MLEYEGEHEKHDEGDDQQADAAVVELFFVVFIDPLELSTASRELAKHAVDLAVHLLEHHPLLGEFLAHGGGLQMETLHGLVDHVELAVLLAQQLLLHGVVVGRGSGRVRRGVGLEVDVEGVSVFCFRSERAEELCALGQLCFELGHRLFARIDLFKRQGLLVAHDFYAFLQVGDRFLDIADNICDFGGVCVAGELLSLQDLR